MDRSKHNNQKEALGSNQLAGSKSHDPVDSDHAPNRLLLLRERIDSTDQKILKLFAERMQIAREVAAAKAGTDKPVYDPKREEQILAAVRAGWQGPDVQRAENLMRGLMRLSRGAQYDLLKDTDFDYGLAEVLSAADDQLPAADHIVYQGSETSYSSRAARILFPEVDKYSVTTFAQACSNVVDNLADAAVLPLENSTAGTVDDVYDLMIEHHLTIWKSISLPIRHRLLAVPGSRLEDIMEVVSHPQALAQCSEAIRLYGWNVRESLNTAYAAQETARAGDVHTAAIASDEAAAGFGLDIILPDLCNTPHNQTRFIVVGRHAVITPDADRMSLVLRLPHQSGALAATLALFADRGLNLSKIQSRPDPYQPWAYLFYLDIDCKAGDPQALSALYQLSCEMPYLKFLGWYREQTMT